MLNDLENFQATTEHRRPGRILYYADFVEDLHQRVVKHIGTEDFARHYGMIQPVEMTVPRPKDAKPLDYSKYWENEDLPPGTRFSPFGAAKVPSGFYHFFGFISPLRNATSLSELENYPIPEYDRSDCSELRPKVEQAHREGKVVKAYIGHMYETAWQIRGYEEFLMDMLDQPAWAECLLERIFEQNLIMGKALAAAGADWIITGDDVASQKNLMFPPDLWRTMMLSRWRKVWRAIKDIHPQAKIWYHSDGNIIDIIPDLIEAGVDILNPLQPECLDLDEVYRRFGGKVAFDGCLGTQSTMPWGSPEDVRNRIRELIDKYEQQGGLMISPTHILEPEVPIANIEAFCQACQEFGTFE